MNTKSTISTSEKPSGFFSQLSWLTAPHSSIKDSASRQKAELSARFTLVMFLLSVIGYLAAIPSNGLEESFLNFGVSMVMGLIAYVMSRSPYYTLGAFILSLSFLISPFVIAVNTTTTRDTQALIIEFHALGLIIASALTNSWATWLLTGLSVAGVFSMTFIGLPLPTNIGGLTGILTTMGLVLVILNNFRNKVEYTRLAELEIVNRELSSIRDSLEMRIQERTEEINRRSIQLEASAMVARTAAEFRNLEDVINHVVDQITDRFGYYHAGVFLAESSRQFVTLQAASSPGGKRMVERGHRLEVGRQGIVGYAAYQKKPRIAQDVGADAVFFNNPYLPETHSEIALPLVVQNRLIGVLDIQSKDINAFGQEDVYTLQTMADQVALAIENARLLAESQSALDELQRITSRGTLMAWKEKFSHEERSYTYNAFGLAKSNKDISKEPASEHNLKIPIRLRGYQVGTLLLKRKEAEEQWSSKEQELAEKVADQVALAIDNARLLDDSQRRAKREETINEFTSRFNRSLNVDTLLQNAARELHSLPQVIEVSVLLKPSEITQEVK